MTKCDLLLEFKVGSTYKNQPILLYSITQKVKSNFIPIDNKDDLIQVTIFHNKLFFKKLKNSWNNTNLNSPKNSRVKVCGFSSPNNE